MKPWGSRIRVPVCWCSNNYFTIYLTRAYWSLWRTKLFTPWSQGDIFGEGEKRW